MYPLILAKKNVVKTHGEILDYANNKPYNIECYARISEHFF